MNLIWFRLFRLSVILIISFDFISIIVYILTPQYTFFFKVTFCIPTIDNNMTWQQCIMFMTNKFGENLIIMIFWWFLGIFVSIFLYFYPVIYLFLFKVTFCIPNINNNMTWQQCIMFMTNTIYESLVKLHFFVFFGNL